jgi:hypothetical protein
LGIHPNIIFNPEAGCGRIAVPWNKALPLGLSHNLVEVVNSPVCLPKVALKQQPWALRQNLFGNLCKRALFQELLLVCGFFECSASYFANPILKIPFFDLILWSAPLLMPG